MAELWKILISYNSSWKIWTATLRTRWKRFVNGYIFGFLEQLQSKKYACRIILIKNLKTPRKCNLCYSRKHRYEDLLLSLWWCLLKFVLTICVIYLNDITRLVVLFTVWLTGKDFFSLLKYGSFLFVFFFIKYLSSTWRIRIFVNKIQF